MRVTTDAPPATLLAAPWPAVTITATYGDGRPRRLLGYTLTCLTCRATWPAVPSRNGQHTDTGLHRQARAHHCDEGNTRP